MPESSYRERLQASILSVAREIVSSDGLQGLQARRIAQGAGCSVGTIYNLYNGLDDLIIKVNAATVGQLCDLLNAENKQSIGLSLSDRLLALGMSYLKFAFENQASWRAVFQHQLPQDRFIPDWYRERQVLLFQPMADILAEVAPEIDQRLQLARTLFSSLHGIISIALDPKLGDFDREATIGQIQLVVVATARDIAHRQSSAQGSRADEFGDVDRVRN
ncbi:MAG: TetR/AcrR family transcriptional regulator [Hyphomicrobiaceae bacterium]